MNEAKIRLVAGEEDVEAVRALCREFVTWQLREFPHLREKIRAYFEPGRWERTLADLPRIHARPDGAILLATLGGAPVGCIMHREAAPGVAEVKRLFVTDAARGHGVGRALVTGMLDQAARDGYRTVRLDTAKFLTAAIGLYGKMGFRECPPFDGVPPDAAEVAVFMERPLTPAPDR